MLGDIAISEPAAAIGFAGARVIKETIRETLPEDFQRAEYLLDHGMLDMVVHRHTLHDTLARTLKLLMEPTPGAMVIPAAPGVEIPAPPTVRAPRRPRTKAEPKA
jgi:acetyl-CoA carboxylase carboxyl transferase subunit beta